MVAEVRSPESKKEHERIEGGAGSEEKTGSEKNESVITDQH
jgi:hypothetical protein